MPQELHVLKCFACEIFQVHIVKKILKWQCKLCGEKQSLKKVYGQGSGKECRNHVQRLNKLLGDTLGATQNAAKGIAVLKQSLPDSYAVNKQSSKWANYLDNMASDVNDDGIQDGESEYTTEVIVFKNAKRKRKSTTKGNEKLLMMGHDCNSVISPIPLDEVLLGTNEEANISYYNAASKFNVPNELLFQEISTLKSSNLPIVNEELAEKYNSKHSLNNSFLDDFYCKLKHVNASEVSSKLEAFNNSEGQIRTNSDSHNNFQDKMYGLRRHVESSQFDSELDAKWPTRDDLHVRQNELKSMGTIKNNTHQIPNKAAANKSKWDVFCPETQDLTNLDELYGAPVVRNESVEVDCSNTFLARQGNVNNLNSDDTNSVITNVLKDRSNIFELIEDNFDEALDFM